jgi:prophage DNA circulation protein
MGWRERLLPASFRRVPFYVDRSRDSFGRKVITHEFPERDTPYSEDLGRATRRYNVSGYLLGNDYLEQRDELLAACENRNTPGELIHPYLGAISVVCISFGTSEDITENNMLRISLEFVESGEEFFPAEVIDQKFQNANNKLSALDAAKQRLIDIFTLTRMPINKIEEIRTNVRAAISLIEETRLIVKSIASYRRLVTRTSDDVESLINNAADLGDSFANLLTFGTFPSGFYPTDRSDEYDEDNEDNPATGDNSQAQLSELRSMWDWSPTSTTDSSDAFVNFIQQVSVMAAAGLVSDIQYGSLDEAEEFRDAIVDKINEILEANLDTDLAGALRDLRTSVINEISIKGINLSRLVEIVPVESVPALVLSFRLYDTVDEEQSIINRNKTIHNPGFVPGGAPIEVLIDV